MATAYGDINSGNTSKNAIESGTVEITNKENAYALPETGGSGNRWIYMVKWIRAGTRGRNITFL